VPKHFAKEGDPDFDFGGASAETAEADYGVLVTEFERVRAAFDGVPCTGR
jgi:hypothetical protein